MNSISGSGGSAADTAEDWDFAFDVYGERTGVVARAVLEGGGCRRSKEGECGKRSVCGVRSV